MVKFHRYAENPQDWIAHIVKHRGPKDVLMLQSAIDLYGTNVTPLLKKALGIADILFALGLDNETLAAALAYPVLQAHEVNIDTITDVFGESSSRLLRDILQMQSLGKIQHLEQRGHAQLENFRKMLLAMVTDVRSVLIILAERLNQLREAKEELTLADQQKLAQETYDVYAPLANRLGVWQLKWEIEDLCLRYLKPDIYTTIAKSLASKREEREKFILEMITVLTQTLQKAAIQKFEVSGRVKHIYSIYKKMLRKGADFEKIYDISALRVLVPEISDCYAVLSVLQDHWEQVPEEFDDYINQPKPNGYRSIHTVIIVPDKHFVEVQVRTYQMHQESELGVAAHWRYKEGVLQPSNYEEKIALLRQIIAWQKEVTSAPPLQSGQKQQDLFSDRIYVFTPTGDIVDLPQGATPLDFAYHIHSEVGHRCRGAKVDGKLVPLTYQLQTGSRVEILTAKQPNPSRDWLNLHLGYLKTPRARAKVQYWFRVKDNAENIVTGRELLEKELKKLGAPHKFDLAKIAHEFHFKTADELFVAISAGDVRVSQIIHHLMPVSIAEPHPTAVPHPATKEATSNIQISGVSNLLTQIAQCCKPMLGDAIIGYITQARGISIHRRTCKNITNIKDENKTRLIEVQWGKKQAVSYPIDLYLRVFDREGLLRDITALLSSEKINVLGLQTHTKPSANEATIYLTIETSNADQLKSAIEHLKKIPNIIEIRRR